MFVDGDDGTDGAESDGDQEFDQDDGSKIEVLGGLDDAEISDVDGFGEGQEHCETEEDGEETIDDGFDDEGHADEPIRSAD